MLSFALELNLYSTFRLSTTDGCQYHGLFLKPQVSNLPQEELNLGSLRIEIHKRDKYGLCRHANSNK